MTDGTRNRGRAMVRLALVAVLTFAIASAGAAQQPASAERAVYALMQCHECRDGELRRVTALGAAAVPLLSSLLLEGPPPHHIAKYERSLLSVASGRGGSPGVQASTLAGQVEDFRTMYRVRAAAALASIGGGTARTALCAARSASPARPAVRVAVDSALRRVGGACG